MRLTLQLIRSRAKGPLQNLEYLDLSNLELVAIEKLNTCPRLHTLLLQDNNINDVSNLDVCANLWNLDLSNNALKSLDGLSRFVAFGSVVLSNNDLSWHELGKIRHIHIISLSLHGNQQLEKDPYYRIHVIDCLPNLWMLDGRIITSAERQQVKHFFQDSALTDHPVRHKLAKEWFIPSNLKKLDVNGVFGQKATHMMRRFPTNAVHNIETDKKRLMYIAYTFQENIVIENKYNKMDLQILKYNPCFLEDLLEVRPKDVERCNMLLLLLVASLEFVLPTHLVKETLDTTKLSKVGKVYSMDLFLLPRDIRCSVLCVLLAAVKIDKDNREEGGLYDKLYLCLFYTVAELIKLSQSQNNKQAAIRSKLNTVYSDYKCLLASELVQLLCIVPAFFEYVNRDVGVMNLVVTATGDTMIVDKVKRIAANIVEEGGELKKLYEETADFLLQKVQEQTMNLANRTAKIQISDEVLNQKRAFPMRPALSAVDISEYHSRGISSPNKDPPRVLSAKKMSERQRKRFPHLGDILLLGPQTLGKIVSLPQPFVALVSMDAVPVASGAMECKLKQSDDHFTYVNMDQLLFDLELGLWKPKGSIGDSLLKEYQNNHKLPKPRLTMQNLEDLKKELERKASTADQTPRPNSPEWTRPLTAQESSPLVYSSQRPKTAVEFSTAPKDGLDTPRPMSSLLKEKLDLKLEMIQRKTIDIDVDKALNQSSPSPETPRLNESKSQTDQSTDSHVKEEGHQLECVHCAMEAARARQQQQEEEEEKNVIPKQDIVENEDNKENTLEKEDQSAQEPFHMPVSISGTHIELQIPGQNDGSSTARSVTKSPTRTVSSARRPASSRRSTPSFGPFSGKTKKLSPRTRPFSAVDAYKYIVAHPIRPSLSQENTYNSSYQTQRMEAWKQSVQDKAAQNKEVKDETIVNEKIIIKGEITPVSIKTEERQKSPPPQRPCSPAARGQLPPSANRPGSAVLNLSDCNRWLAGGRDLYWESVTKRPKSGHVPGWKDGLPDSMTRPKSAVAARALRRSRTATPVTPSSLMYETLLQGYHAGDYSLPELTDLSDYQKTPHAYLTRALGLPQHNSGEDFFIPPSPSAVYRWG